MAVHNDLSRPISFEGVYRNFPTQETSNVHLHFMLGLRTTFGIIDPQLSLDSDPFFVMTDSGPSSRKIPIPNYTFAISDASSSQIDKDSDVFCISLHVNSLAELSLNLPTELSNIVQDKTLSESVRIMRVKNFLKKYHIDRKDLLSLPFYIHLWKKPELLKEACAFGVARQRSLHKKMIDRKVEILHFSKYNYWGSMPLQAIAGCEAIAHLWNDIPAFPTLNIELLKSISTSHFVSSVTNVFHSSKFYIFAGTALFAALNLKIVSAFVSSFKHNQNQEIDLQSLKETKNYAAALHYLESVQVYRQSSWANKIKSFCIPHFKDSASKRVDNLRLNGKKYEIKTAENFGQRFLNLISRLFSKVLSLVCWPFEKKSLRPL